MSRLIHSAKFLTAVLDAFVSSLAIVLAWFLAPDKVTQVMTLVGIWQPVFIAVIAGIAYEDGQAKQGALKSETILDLQNRLEAALQTIADWVDDDDEDDAEPEE